MVPYSWHQDEPIEELYEERIIAFIDVLGFREQITHSDIDPNRFAQIFTLLEALYRAAYWLQASTADARQYISVRMTTFSDNIVVSAEPTPHGMILMLKIIQIFHLEALKLGYLMRGGISVGQIFHSTGPVFGPGFVRAYDLERLYAKVPRTILDENVVSRFFRPEPYKKFPNAIEIIRDSDNSYFVPYRFEPFAYEDIFGKLSSLPDSVRPKIEWFANWMLVQNQTVDRGYAMSVPRFDPKRPKQQYELYSRRTGPVEPHSDASINDDSTDNDIPF